MIDILIILILILVGVAITLWLLPTLFMDNLRSLRFGQSEGLELVCKIDRWGNETFVVENDKRECLFIIPLHNCMIDERYHDGKLRFRENGTNREGYIDTQGTVVFLTPSPTPSATDENRNGTIVASSQERTEPQPDRTDTRPASGRTIKTDADLRRMAADNPFYKEAAKVLSGKLAEDDAQKRRMILNYCEHLRTAYTTKDIDFLKQVFSEQALIIVGNVVSAKPEEDGKYLPEERVTYNIRTKQEYIERIGKAFAANRKIDVQFSDFHIMRHPTVAGIYGVSLRQQYKSDRYGDDGYLFLLWDFRDKSMPVIHVRTWQPTATINDTNGVITIRDFNLE